LTTLQQVSGPQCRPRCGSWQDGEDDFQLTTTATAYPAPWRPSPSP